MSNELKKIATEDFSIGERIKNRRLELRLSLDYISAKIGAPKEYLEFVEEEGNEVNLIIFGERLAKALRCPPEYLWGYNKKPIEKEFNKIISKNLIYYLNISRMTQNELARRVGVSKSSVSNWVNGIKAPRIDKIDRICEIFNTKHENLLYDKKADARYSNPTIDRYCSLDGDIKEAVDNFLQYICDENAEVIVTEENENYSETKIVYQVRIPHVW